MVTAKNTRIVISLTCAGDRLSGYVSRGLQRETMGTLGHCSKLHGHRVYIAAGSTWQRCTRSRFCIVAQDWKCFEIAGARGRATCPLGLALAMRTAHDARSRGRGSKTHGRLLGQYAGTTNARLLDIRSVQTILVVSSHNCRVVCAPTNGVDAAHAVVCCRRLWRHRECASPSQHGIGARLSQGRIGGRSTGKSSEK